MPRIQKLLLITIFIATLAVGVIGCGSSNNAGTPTVNRPELTVPDEKVVPGSGRSDSASSSTAPTGTDPSTDQQPAGTDSQPNGGAAPQTNNDSPKNDTPPPKGSPAENFENFCSQNPGAC